MARLETKKKREELRYNGVVILTCELSYPKAGICESFFEQICEKCLLWAKEKSYQRLSEEYDNDGNPKKRFTFGYEYRVTITTEEGDGEYVNCRFFSRLKKRGSGEIIFESEKDFIMRESDGQIISERYFNRLKKRQDKQKKADASVSNDEK